MNVASSVTKPLKVLMDLRTTLTGHSGISQETRLLFSSFQDIDCANVYGLINKDLDAIGKALPLKWRDREIPSLKKYGNLSRFLLSLNKRPDTQFPSYAKRYLLRRLDALRLSARGRLNIYQKLTYLEALAFGDCIWEMMFSKSLPISDWDRVVNAQYRVLGAPYFSMHHAGLVPGGDYPVIDTRGFDALLCPNPYPARPAPGTQLIIRYHDAIPMFFPHFIPDFRFHQRSHASALRSNARNGIFVCTTDAVRSDLLTLFPEVEARSCTIHDMVSHNYYAEVVEKRQICEIVRSRLFDATEPKFLTLLDKKLFYDKYIRADNFEYLLYVSVIDPRKNHQRLIRALEIVQQRCSEHLKLVFVGYPGQSVDKVLTAMQVLQRRGQLFHLSDLSSDELRTLYAGAECTVCPSIAEGFDLSGIEAMQSGGVVATSDTAVHREVYGDASVYFDAYSISAQAKAIESVIHPDRRGFREELRRKGAIHAQQYSRERISDKWTAFFEDLRSRSAVAAE